MKITQYLQDLKNSGIEDPFAVLTEKFAIKVRDYPEHGVSLLDYNQIDSPKSEPLVMECRSLIVDRNDFRVISKKFNRFFNFGEMPEFYSDFNFDSSIVFEKADGSLCGFWYNPHTDRMEISTRGMAMAEGEHVMGGTFRERILSAANLTEERLQDLGRHQFFRDHTLVCEFVSPENRIVTRYPEDKLVLLSVTNGTLDAIDIDSVSTICDFLKSLGFNIRMPKIYDKSTSLAEMVDVANSLADLQEGFVVYDPTSGKRVKIKSSTYLVAHRLRGEDMIPTRKNILTLIFEGEVSEILAYFPEYKKYIDPVEEEVEFLKEQMQLAWSQYRDIESQKDFALAVKDLPFSGILFTSRKLKQDPHKSLRELAMPAKLRLFGG